MGKKNTKGTHKVNLLVDDGNTAPSYETAFGVSNTDVEKRRKHDKHVDFNSCLCNTNKKTNKIRKRTKNWESITNLYGDADTTTVWDNKEQKPKTFFRSSLRKQENPTTMIENSQNDDVIIYPTSNLNNKPAKLSLFSLYRRRKNNDHKINKGQYVNEKSKDIDIKSMYYTKPKLRHQLRRKHKKGLKDQNAIELAICKEGPCREALENLYNLYGLNYTPNTNAIYKKEKVTKSGNNKKKKEKIYPGTTTKHDEFIPNINEIYKKQKITKYGHKNKKEQLYTIAPTKEDNIIKKSKKKHAEAIKTTKNGNVGYGDQISPTPLKKDLIDRQSKYSFFGKIMGRTICKCNNNNGLTLQTLSNVSNQHGDMGHPICKCNNNNGLTLQTLSNDSNQYGNMGHTICKCNNNNGLTLQTLSNDSNQHGDMGHTICKCNNNNGLTLQTSSNVNNQHGDPFLEIKVNSTDMRVINSSEVKDNLRKLGKQEKNKSCVCPSRMKRLNRDKVCERGLCGIALNNKHTHFDCKCVKHNIIECKDSTCKLKKKKKRICTMKKRICTMKKRICKEKKIPETPLFKVMLDSTYMNIINSNEIKDIIGKTSENKLSCPTGICNTMSKQKNGQFICKCIGKKMAPIVYECEERTCRIPEKKCRLSYLCSRIFSKSENWTWQDGNIKRRPIRGHGYNKNMTRDDIIVRSHNRNKRNGVTINLPSSQTKKKGTYVRRILSDARYKSLCESAAKQAKKEQSIKKEIKTHHRTLSEKILDCIDKQKEQYEIRTQEEIKKYMKKEKKAIKENKKITAKQKKLSGRRHRTNCLTNHISGALNVAFGSVRTAFNIIFSLIRNPKGSIIYVKEKSKHPSAAIIRISKWFGRTWNNKSSVIAKQLEESHTLNVITDQIEDSLPFTALFVPKGKSKNKKILLERRERMRKRRMQKRRDEAVYGCRHTTLMTMRKTPCIWCYYICPNLYPQCLSLLSFIKTFLNVLIYLLAIICWTPCIVSFEMCRAFMCCFFCTH